MEILHLTDTEQRRALDIEQSLEHMPGIIKQLVSSINFFWVSVMSCDQMPKVTKKADAARCEKVYHNKSCLLEILELWQHAILCMAFFSIEKSVPKMEGQGFSPGQGFQVLPSPKR